MKSKISFFFIVSILLSSYTVFADGYTITPDGSYVGGDSYTITPDGSYVGDDSYTITPDGSYVGQ